MTEQSIIGARASVMVYDDNQKKWVPSGTSSGLSKVQIYHHQQNNTFRVVGRKLQDHEVVINCSILKGLKYNQATATFHQWRDSKYVYGLNFSSQNDAEAFARAMMHALEVLSGRVNNQPGQPTNGNGYEEDMGYRTMTSEDAAILRQQQQVTGQATPSAQTPTSQTNQNNIPQSPPTPQGHHRTSSAPPAPQPQQMSVPQQQQQQQLYAQSSNVQNHNGLQTQLSTAPGQTQYHTPQQQQAQHPVYASQPLIATGFSQQNQYQQSHYALSSSNSNLNVHQYPQQTTASSQQQIPALHQSQNNAPMYVANQPQISQGIPSSSSANSVVYASQQQLTGSNPLTTQHSSIGNGLQPPSSTYGQINTAQNQQGQLQENVYGSTSTCPPVIQPNNVSNGFIPNPPPLNRMSSTTTVGCSANTSAPVAPPPPPNFSGYNVATLNSAPPPAPQPPIPPAPPGLNANKAGSCTTAAPPPPPPPPVIGGAKKEDPQSDLMGSLAAQLQQAKLKKNKSSTSAPESNGSSTSSGGSSNYGTIGRSSCGMASMMDEMAKTLARRRAQAEKKEPEPEPEVKQRQWEKSNTLPHKLGSSNATNVTSSNNTTNTSGDSPRPIRKRFGSASEETILKVNGDSLSLAMSSSDLDALKSEIVREMRAEIQKVKQDIIEAIKSEFNRR